MHKIQCVGRRRLEVSPHPDEPKNFLIKIVLSRGGGDQALAHLVLTPKEAKKLQKAMNTLLKRVTT